MAFPGRGLDSSCPSRSSGNFNGLGYEASPLSSSLLHRAKSPAVCLERGLGRILVTVGESLPFGGSWQNLNRLGFLLSGSSSLEDHRAVSISMGVLMEAACQVRLTVCLVPSHSGKCPCLLLSPPEQQITFQFHRDRLLGLLAAHWLACPKLGRHILV